MIEKQIEFTKIKQIWSDFAITEKAKEEIDRLKQQLEEAERLFRVALINKAPFRRVDGCDDYGDDNEDDGNGNGNNDSLSTCLV